MTEKQIDDFRVLVLRKLGSVEGLPFHDLLKLAPIDGAQGDAPPETVEENVMMAYVAIRSLLAEDEIKLYPLLRRNGEYIRPGQVRPIDTRRDEWTLCLIINDKKRDQPQTVQ